MVNPYDKARELAAAIRESDEYRDYLASKEKAQQNPELVSALNDYQEKQFDMQKRQVVGEEIGPEMMAQMQNLYQILARDPVAAEYLNAQMRFAMMANDVYSVLGDVLKS
ncbi:MAG: YlbF family regulator [Clostridiales Family XIII bacterium]|nr:YlbF family regulator [Clostridiales Family XIII bacterium]